MRQDWRSREAAYFQDGLQFSLGSEYPELIQKLFMGRGISDPEVAHRFLQPKLSELKDPYSISGMSQAVSRLLQARSQQEKLCIYADFDLDGTSGLALLYFSLLQMGFHQVMYYQPKRLSEGYGFHASAVEDLKKEGVSLIITVDVGITAHEACEKANALGIDVILTDHHQPAETLPLALVILNPNQKACPSGLNYLCGAGVAFYLVRALYRKLVLEAGFPASGFDLKSVLDFYTIATLTDMVPLVDDNRVLVKHGLIQLQSTRRPGLRKLLEALGLDRQMLSAQDVAIRFAPKLNALSRLESDILPRDIFLADDDERASVLVETMLEHNSTRVTLQESGETEAQEILLQWEKSEFVFVSSEKFHRGVVGLIATKLSQKMNRPSFVGSVSVDGSIVGSARAPSGADHSVLAALESASKHLVRFGGHHQAAGFELHQSSKDQFIAALENYFVELDQQEASAVIEYDLDLQLEQISGGLMRWLDSLGPYGQGFPVPLFCFRNLQVLSVQNLKGGHCKLKFHQSEHEALYFSPVGYLPKEGDKIDILAELQWNTFAGRRKLQLLVRSARRTLLSHKNEVSPQL